MASLVWLPNILPSLPQPPPKSEPRTSSRSSTTPSRGSDHDYPPRPHSPTPPISPTGDRDYSSPHSEDGRRVEQEGEEEEVEEKEEEVEEEEEEEEDNAAG